MTTFLIALLISLGIIQAPEDLDNLSPEQENQIEIVIEDLNIV